MKSLKLGILLAVLVVVIAGGYYGLVYYPSYHPKVIAQGDNKYILGSYSLEEKGLTGFEEIINKTQGMQPQYTIAYFEAYLTKKGEVKSFTLSLDTFDENGEYKGIAGYSYQNKTLTYTFTPEDNSPLVVKQNQNSSLPYLDEQIRKIPIKEQLAVSEWTQYALRYQPFTQIEEGTPIFDGRDAAPFPVLPQERYNMQAGGTSDGKTSVVMRLYDGTGITTEQQYLYVFPPIDPQTAVGNQLSSMQCDYTISTGTLKFTRDYGESWIEGRITDLELEDTLSFYRNNLSLPPQSIFISPDTTLPIAFFYGSNPKLKILSGEDWKQIPFPTAAEFGREVTKRVVGFVTPDFGYAAIGTDWSMGSGENKMCYFTTDAGATWKEKPLPLQGTGRTLIDMQMATQEIGAITLDAGMDVYFPKVFVTDDQGESWTEITLPFSQVTQVQFLTDIEAFRYEDGGYTLTLGQGDNGNMKAVFTADNLTDGWQFKETYRTTIHTVG